MPTLDSTRDDQHFPLGVSPKYRPFPARAICQLIEGSCFFVPDLLQSALKVSDDPDAAQQKHGHKEAQDRSFLGAGQ
jgi:hypothetical protein